MFRLALVLIVALVGAACATGADNTLTVYSGRSEELVGPVIERFEEATGIDVEVRYGDTAELAAAIAEEGSNTPADVFWAQDAGALGALSHRFADLPARLLDRVDDRFVSPEGRWVGTSGRARVLVYNTDALDADDLPASVLELTDPVWAGRIGWAPTNGSFQSFVTALRVVEGDDAARSWLEDMVANDTQVYAKNSPIVAAVASGEIDAGLVNHYYLLEMGADDPSIAAGAANHFFPGGDVGSLVNVAGMGVLESAAPQDDALALIDFLLSRDAGTYFDEEVFEYPLGDSAGTPDGLPPLVDLDQPDIDLSDLSDLEGTLDLLDEAGAL